MSNREAENPPSVTKQPVRAVKCSTFYGKLMLPVWAAAGQRGRDQGCPRSNGGVGGLSWAVSGRNSPPHHRWSGNPLSLLHTDTHTVYTWDVARQPVWYTKHNFIFIYFKDILLDTRGVYRSWYGETLTKKFSRPHTKVKTSYSYMRSL